MSSWKSLFKTFQIKLSYLSELQVHNSISFSVARVHSYEKRLIHHQTINRKLAKKKKKKNFSSHLNLQLPTSVTRDAILNAEINFNVG